MPKLEKGQKIKLTNVYVEVYCTRDDCARFKSGGGSCRLMRGEIEPEDDGDYARDTMSVTVWCDYFAPKTNGEASKKGD